MGHQITETDKVLSVREYTWHGLEHYSEEYLSIEDTRKLVHDWDVIREPVYRKVYDIVDNEPVERFELVEQFQLNVRSDNAADLAVVPTDRVDVSIDHMYQLVETVQGADANVLIETAGSLRGGKDVFVLLRLDEPIHVQGDKHGESLPFAAFQNSYEPGAAFRMQATSVRIVCKNTSRLADLNADHSGMNLAFAHTSNMNERIEEARFALSAWREDVREWVLAKEFLATQKVSIDGINWFVNHWMPEPDAALTSDRVKANIERDRLAIIGEIFNPMNEGIEQTALGLFEGASSWHEHVRNAQSPMTRFKRSVLSPSSVLADARDLALEAAKI